MNSIVEINPDNQSPHSNEENEVIAHSTRFSLFDKDFIPHDWLKKSRKNIGSRRVQGLSVHYGINRFENKKLWTFLPIQPNQFQILMAIDRLKFLQDHFGCPVGVENLALAMSKEDVFRQVDSLENIIAKADAFLLLDLHNVFCQSQNFKIDFMTLIQVYSLEKVFEIHVSGGSESIYNGEIFRRDTHDGPVPPTINEILPTVVSQTKNLRWIIHESAPETNEQFTQPRKFFETAATQADEDPRAVAVLNELIQKWEIRDQL